MYDRLRLGWGSLAFTLTTVMTYSFATLASFGNLVRLLHLFADDNVYDARRHVLNPIWDSEPCSVVNGRCVFKRAERTRERVTYAEVEAE